MYVPCVYRSELVGRVSGGGAVEALAFFSFRRRGKWKSEEELKKNLANERRFPVTRPESIQI